MYRYHHKGINLLAHDFKLADWLIYLQVRTCTNMHLFWQQKQDFWYEIGPGFWLAVSSYSKLPTFTVMDPKWGMLLLIAILTIIFVWKSIVNYFSTCTSEMNGVHFMGHPIYTFMYVNCTHQTGSFISMNSSSAESLHIGTSVVIQW
jgi:hypothetical protein